MREVETQLRTYFDEVVERVTEDDIRVRATTERGIPIAAHRLQLRPVAAVAIGFGAAMTLLGGFMVANEFLGGEPQDAGGGPVPGASTASDSPSLWLLLLLMAGFGFLAFGMWSARRDAGDMRERGDENMQTIEKPGTAHAPPGDITKYKNRNRLLTWLVGILAIAVVGLGAWLVAEMGGSSGTDLPSEVQAVLDDYLTAWNEGNPDGVLAHTSADYEFETEGYTFSGEGMRTNIAAAQSMRFEVEVVDQIASGDGPYYVSTADAATMNDQTRSGVSTFTIKQEDGVWKVARHYYTGEL